MRQDHVFDDGYTDDSPLLEDIHALDRLADPQACGTRQDRVVQDECTLLDDLRAADRILFGRSAIAEDDITEESPNLLDRQVQQIANGDRGAKPRAYLKKNIEPEYVSAAPIPFQQPPFPLARAPPCVFASRRLRIAD
ncbi:hypothetical protein MCRY_13855 [Marivita cryptomonadis]|nr:hypothetical protein MCRY_13855 [Marivita cryptomonadis]